jgi:peptide/nickel transport system substrate-binding protein
VKAGKLPPVDKRLPADPLVVPVVERTGRYGGVWRRAFLGPADANDYVRVVYDATPHPDDELSRLQGERTTS